MATLSDAPFGDLLRRLRKAAGLTQAELAERAGLSVRGLNDLERGARSTPRRETAQLLADALGLGGEERAGFLGATRGARREPAPSLREVPEQATRAHEEAQAQEAAAPAAAAPSPPSGTVTFLFTDIAGSTQLLQQLGPRYADVLTAHQRLLREAFAAHGGYEVDTQGDSFFVAFPTAPDALAAAAKATRALARYPWPNEATVRVRMGLHSGAPQLVGDRYVGPDVHRAARIAAAGHGGQVLLSAAAAELARHDLPDRMTLCDVGTHRLKDLQQAERFYQAVLADLPADFPPLRALDARPHNLPFQPTVLLGREREVAAVCALVRRGDVRLVTVTGLGGIGKTRLSLQVAAEVLDAFPDGVWSVRLSRLTDPELVILTIATTLDLNERGGTPLAEVLRGYLRDKHLLLVLDNFEQVVPAAPQIGELLAACPSLKVLVTSRVPLHLRGEHEYALQPLALPDPQHLPPPELLSQYAAVALFIERAQAVQSEFRVTSASALAVAEICARLDGLPLAIELAAAWIKVLPPPALLKRLERSLPLLVGGARDLDERQRTMKATIAWSYDLLSHEEQRLFRRLAVFVGGCTLEAAETVCAAPAGAEPLGLDLLDGLTRLIDHNLIQQREVAGEPRIAMLRVVRAFALERLGAGDPITLDEPTEVVAIRQAHLAYFLDLAEESLQPLQGPDAGAWLARLDVERDNLRAALAWARDCGEAGRRATLERGLQLGAALGPFWFLRRHHHEGRWWLEMLLALPSALGGASQDAPVARDGAGRGREGAVPPPDVARMWALLYAGIFASNEEDIGRAVALWEEGLVAARAAGSAHAMVMALTGLGSVLLRHEGNAGRGLALFQEALDLARQSGAPHTLLNVLCDFSFDLLVCAGHDDRAIALAEEASMIARQVGSAFGQTYAGFLLALGALRRDRPTHARTLARQTLRLAQQHEVTHTVPYCLATLALVAGREGAGVRASRLLGAAMTELERGATVLSPAERCMFDTALAATRVAMGEEAWAAAYAAGRALSLEEAIAEALDEPQPDQARSQSSSEEGGSAG